MYKLCKYFQGIHGTNSLTLPDNLDNDTVRSSGTSSSVLFCSTGYWADTETADTEQRYNQQQQVRYIPTHTHTHTHTHTQTDTDTDT